MEITPQAAEKFLNKLGDGLEAEQAKALAEMKKFAAAEFRGQKKFIEVVTDIEAAENFSPVEDTDCIFFADRQSFDEDKTISSGSFFLRTSYEDFFSFTDKNFQGAGFTYQLKPNYRFVEAEEKIFRVGRIYREPVEIFSPYARRAVDICIFGEPQELNFRFEENNLAGKILADKKFYWNVEIKSAEDFFDELGDSDYLLPNTPPEFDDGLVAKKIDGKIIFEPTENIYPDEFELIKILPTENKIAPNIFGKQRLRTRGDVEFVLSGLERDGYSCRFGKFGDSGAKKIRRYTAEHRYPCLRDEEFLRAKMRLPVCTVKFKGEEIFLTDYANFVLNFLEQNFPEFNWAGERDE